MGWTNSHLHHFKIEDRYLGDPELVNEDAGEIEHENSKRIKIADILPENSGLFCFAYDYDFGDGRKHKIQFEGMCADAEFEVRCEAQAAIERIRGGVPGSTPMRKRISNGS